MRRGRIEEKRKTEEKKKNEEMQNKEEKRKTEQKKKNEERKNKEEQRNHSHGKTQAATNRFAVNHKVPSLWEDFSASCTHAAVAKTVT